MATKAKEKKKFQLPHLLFLLLGLLMVMSLLTYVLPAGQFVEVSEGVKEYMLLESRTPVSIWQALLYIYDGIANSSSILALLLIIGGCVEVVLATKALDRVIDGLIYKLRDKGSAVLLPIMFFLMALLGGFGGSDALIAVIPIGVLVAKKLRLDPIVGAGVSFLGTMVGFSTTPHRHLHCAGPDGRAPVFRLRLPHAEPGYVRSHRCHLPDHLRQAGGKEPHEIRHGRSGLAGRPE